jgi:stearoyl-CoA desaturase (delta-9 desaturase)
MFDKRYILTGMQIISIPITTWALLTQATPILVAATLFMFFMYKCLGVVATYHRILCHRVGKMNPLVQIICTALGFYGSLLSPVTWAGVHIDHHKYVDTDKDPHSATHLGWRGWFSILWKDSVDLRVMARLKRDSISNFFHEYYYSLLTLPLLLLFWPKIFLFFWFIPASMSLWSQHISVYNHDETGAKEMPWWFGVLTMGEHHHKWHHDHPNDTSGEGWIHYITKALTYADSR